MNYGKLVNMVEPVRDLNTVLEEDLVKDFPFFEGVELVLWTDTSNCKPITHKITIQNLSQLTYDEIKKMFKAIEGIFPIAAIIVKGYKVYRVTKTEEFMNKACES